MFFSFFYFLFWEMDRIDKTIVIGSPQSFKEIVKSADAGSIINRETAEDSKQGIDAKKIAPFGDRWDIELDR